MTAIRSFWSFWQGLHPYLRTVLGGLAGGTVIWGIPVYLALAADIMDAQVADWFALKAILIFGWLLASGIVAAVLAFNSSLLTPEQREAIRKLKKGEL